MNNVKEFNLLLLNNFPLNISRNKFLQHRNLTLSFSARSTRAKSKCNNNTIAPTKPITWLTFLLIHQNIKSSLKTSRGNDRRIINVSHNETI